MIAPRRFTKETDNVYMDVIFTTNGFTTPQVAQYNVTKTIPIIDDCSQYYCSVIRFDIPLNEIPLYIMPIIPNQANPNLTPFVIGIKSGGVDVAQPVIYVPYNTKPVPVQDQVTQVITEYYYVYSYALLINCINNSLYTAWVTAGSPGAFAPYFYFNPVTQLIELIVTAAFVSGGNIIFMNNHMHDYLPGFIYERVGTSGNHQFDILFNTTPFVLNAKSYNIYNGVAITDYNTTPTYYLFAQEYKAITDWNSLRKIIIVSNTIPVIPEVIPVFNNGVQTNVTSSLPIITDFVPSLNDAGDTRSIAYYYPTGQYRLIDMISEVPLIKIDLQIKWIDKQGNVYPLFITPNQQATVKLAFLKKDLYKKYRN